MTGLGRNREYGACCPTQTAHKSNKTSLAKQTTGAKSLLSYKYNTNILSSWPAHDTNSNPMNDFQAAISRDFECHELLHAIAKFIEFANFFSSSQLKRDGDI